jgi:16S rRNA G527 N7-methylase RsmG
LSVSDVEVMPVRYEEVRPEKGSLDVITARAVGGFSDFLEWSRMALSDRGHVALWVGGEDTTNISKTQGWIWNPAIRIPESQRRYILVGRPLNPNLI